MYALDSLPPQEQLDYRIHELQPMLSRTLIAANQDGRTLTFIGSPNPSEQLGLARLVTRMSDVMWDGGDVTADVYRSYVDSQAFYFARALAEAALHVTPVIQPGDYYNGPNHEIREKMLLDSDGYLVKRRSTSQMIDFFMNTIDPTAERRTEATAIASMTLLHIEDHVAQQFQVSVDEECARFAEQLETY